MAGTAIVTSNVRSRSEIARGRGVVTQHHVTLPAEPRSSAIQRNPWPFGYLVARLLLVPVDEPQVTWRRWTEEEIAMLRTAMSAEEIRERTGRSATAVSCKRSAMEINVRTLRQELRGR